MSGGFITIVAGMRVSARSPSASVAAAGVMLVAWLIAAWRAQAIAGDLARVEEWITRRARHVIYAIAGVAAAVTVSFGSFSAGGSDASGYLSQAVMLGDGALSRVEPLAAIADWPDAATTLAPLGWRTAAEAGRQVPTYAVGLPLLMVVPHAMGGAIAASLIVPLSFFVAIVAAGLLALRIAGPVAALLTAVWMATSPVALIESMQPMSDVPVTAAWLVCWLFVVRCLRLEGGTSVPPALAGCAAAIAVLIRPNLAPLAAVPALMIAAGLKSRPPREAAGGRGLSPARIAISLVAFSIPVAMAGAIVAYLQWRWFGSPLRSGYGTAEEIYAFGNIVPNAAVYAGWLLDAHGPWLFVAPLAALLPKPMLRWLLAFAALVVVSYLLYSIFETWTYLRFLLPALAIAAIAVAALIAAALGRLPVAARVAAIAILVLAVAATNIAAARRLGVFRYATQQSRALLAGQYLGAALPPNAVVIAGEQSGSVRYYTDRSIVRWDFLDPAALDSTLARVRVAGYEPWIALDVWEEEPFRAKFRGAAAAALDWPPSVDAGTEIRTRAWRVRDRERFMSGDRVPSDRLR